MLHRITHGAPRALPLLLLAFAVLVVGPAAAQQLLDPVAHPKFVNSVPNPLDPSFI